MKAREEMFRAWMDRLKVEVEFYNHSLDAPALFKPDWMEAQKEVGRVCDQWAVYWFNQQ